MTASTALEALYFLIGFMGLWFLFFVLYRDYRVDLVRHRLFKIRAELFDYAADGSIDFNHPAYSLMRIRINRLIRFAHRFSGIQLILARIALWETGDDLPDPIADWREAVASIEDVAVREKFLNINQRVMATIMLHLVTGSIAVMSCFLLFVIGLVIRVSFRDALGDLREQIRRGVKDRAVGRFASEIRLEKLEFQANEIGEGDLALA